MTSLSCNLLKLAGFFGFFCVFNIIAQKILPKTKKFLQMEKDDPAKARSAYARHISCFVAAFHGLVATIVCSILTVTIGLSFGNPSQEIHNWPIAVRLLHSKNFLTTLVYIRLLPLRYSLRNYLQIQ